VVLAAESDDGLAGGLVAAEGGSRIAHVRCDLKDGNPVDYRVLASVSRTALRRAGDVIQRPVKAFGH